MQLLKRLSEIGGVPGREDQVRELISSEIKDIVDDLQTDAMGNLIAYKKAAREGGKKVMLSAHMDEIGFYVKYIDDKGFLRVHNVGGFDTRNLFARQVTVHTASGENLVGILNPATKPIHIASADERKKIPQMNEFAIDLGLDADTVKDKVRVGDMVTLRQEFVDLGDVVTGKALDDRVNCWILIRVLKELENPAHDVYAVFSVQEEVGLRGATTSAFHVEPDIGIALDTTLAVDVPGTSDDQSVTRLGAGVAIKILDGASISTRWLVDSFVELAEQNEVNYQLEVLPLGGTDARAIQLSRQGVPSLTLSIPSRYVHTVTEMVAKSDLEASIALLKHYLTGR